MKKVLKIAFIEIFSRRKALRPSPALYTPYGVWIGLQTNRFSKIPRKHHLPKISS